MQDAAVRANRGEPTTAMASIEAVYREHGDRLWRAVYLWSGDREVASDSVAEAFAQAIRRGEDLRSPLAWITTAAFRIAAGELQRRRRGVELTSVPASEPISSATELVLALRQLPEKQRQAVVLRFYVGLSHGEIARLAGSTVGAVAVNVHRGRRRLRELMETPDE
jgi:RNA polymerase sigma-70 factor (ECF subfamily)